MAVKYIEAEGVKLAHIADDDKMAALCGAKPFPWDWYQPVKRTRAVCRTCLSKLRRKN